MYLACAENGQSFRDLPGGKGVGTFGGSEDHTAILTCIAGAVSLYQLCAHGVQGGPFVAFRVEARARLFGVRAEKTRKPWKIQPGVAKGFPGRRRIQPFVWKEPGQSRGQEAQSRGQAEHPGGRVAP